MNRTPLNANLLYGFDFEDFEMKSRGVLLEMFPKREEIMEILIYLLKRKASFWTKPSVKKLKMKVIYLLKPGKLPPFYQQYNLSQIFYNYQKSALLPL